MTHLSAYKLDALALDALPPEEAARARAHLDTCAACRAEDESAAALRMHFTAHVLPRVRPRRARTWHLAWLALPALAAAAVALLVVLRPHHASDLGIKGSAAWQVFAHRGEQTFTVHDGTALAAGDRIRFVLEPD